MKKNVSGQKIGAQLISASDGSAFTGSVTVAVTIDAGSQATGSVGSGACTHEGGGYHTYAPSQAETNGDLIAYTFSGTGAIPVTVQVYTLPTTGILAPTTADRTLDVSSTGEAGLDFDNIKQATGATTLNNITVPTVTTTTTATNLTNAPTNGDLTADMKASVNAEVDQAIADAALPSLSQIIAGFGGVLGSVEDHASNSSTQFQSNLAETSDDYYNGGVVAFTSGTNAGQVRRISDYVGASGTITVSPAFDAEPDADDDFVIVGRIN